MRRYFLLFSIFFVLCSFSAHKFYVAIHQINYSSEKKMLQITSRIFVDDLNDALSKKHKMKFHIGESAETPEQTRLMTQYLVDRFQIKVNGKPRALNFLSNELENNVLICYFNVRDVSKVASLEVSNQILFDLVTEQQNIIQTTVNGQKKSLLLTTDNPKGELAF